MIMKPIPSPEASGARLFRMQKIPTFAFAAVLLSASWPKTLPAQTTPPPPDGNAAVGAVLFTVGFPNVHGNGRSCATCHVPENAFQLTPEHVEARFQALERRRLRNPSADDPLFRSLAANDF